MFFLMYWKLKFYILSKIINDNVYRVIIESEVGVIGVVSVIIYCCYCHAILIVFFVNSLLIKKFSFESFNRSRGKDNIRE
jgi:hypothetical protein